MPNGTLLDRGENTRPLLVFSSSTSGSDLFGNYHVHFFERFEVVVVV
jgi:hypothetical protein